MQPLAPPDLAWDAFSEDVPAHIILEHILTSESSLIDSGDKALYSYLKDFLSAALVTHNVGSNTLDLGSRTFTQSLPKAAKVWAKDRVMSIYGHNATNPSSPARPAPPIGSLAPTSPDSVAAFATALAQFAAAQPTTQQPATPVTPDAAADTFKKYGMSIPDLERTLKLCGLTTGQEDQLPGWFQQMAAPKISTNEKNIIVRDLFDQIPFEDYRIPHLPFTEEMIQKRNWTGNDDTLTPSTVMKCLSPYLVSPRTDTEIEAALALHRALTEASTVSTEELLKAKKHLKPVVPKTFQELLNVMRTFANLIRVLFSGGSPFYLALKSDLICSLAKWPEIAKAKVAPTTLAAIMWAVFMQSRHFAHGRMISSNPSQDPKTCPEWATMIMKIKGGEDFTLLSAPLPLSGKTTPLPPPPFPHLPSPPTADNPFEPPTKS